MKANIKSRCPSCNSLSTRKIDRYYGKTSFFNAKRNKLQECMNCGLVFMDPLPKDEQLDEYYNSYWVSENSVQSSSEESKNVYYAQAISRLEFLQNRIGSLKGKAILDFGAGHGLFGEAVKDNKESAKYFAVEADVKIVEHLLEKGIHAATKIDTLQESEFDVIVVFHVLEHIVSPKEFIIELLRHLKKNGVLFIEIPNKDYLWKRNYEPHILFFNEFSLKTLFKSLSFDDYEIISCGRRLQEIPNERKKIKIIRHFIGKIIRYLGVTRKQKNSINSKDFITAYRNIYEMDSFGGDRQWSRAIVHKVN